MSEVRVTRATSFPGSPHINTLYIVENDTNAEFHYVDAAGNHTFMKPGAVVAPLTDSSGGTPGATLAAITAGGSYAQADLVAIKNAIASLAANQASILTSVKNAGLMKTT